MPSIWALWEAGGFKRKWLEQRLEVNVHSAAEALQAAGQVGVLGGVECVIGVQILSSLLERWDGD